MLLEVKRTEDDEYRRNSVYKCLAYLRDFSELWPGDDQRPKALLLFPNSLPSVPSAQIRDLMILGDEQRDRLTELLSAAIN